jgi:hypothetical protein
MKLALCLLTLAILLPPCCLSQAGIVTFYSSNNPIKDQLKEPVTLSGQYPAFQGYLFDGEERLAHLSRGRFLTLRLPPGPHTFSAVYNSKKPGKAIVEINIQSREHYCVRLSTEYKNPAGPLLPVSLVNGQIEQVDCQQALKEAEKTKPLQVDRIDATTRDKLETSTAFPQDK